MAHNPRPHVVIIAGPNGAGKTTLAPLLLRDTFEVMEYVNADAIALGLSAFQPERVALLPGWPVSITMVPAGTVRSQGPFGQSTPGGDEVTFPCPSPVSDTWICTGAGGASENDAVTERSAVMPRSHAPVPLQSPCHPSK